MSGPRWLGLAHGIVAVLLLPLVITLDEIVLIAIPGWLGLLGIQLWHGQSGLGGQLRWTHMIMSVVAVLLMGYGAFVLVASAEHALLRGLLPIGLGIPLGALAVISLAMSRGLDR